MVTLIEAYHTCSSVHRTEATDRNRQHATSISKQQRAKARLHTAKRYHVIYSSNHKTKHVTVNGQACHHSTSNHPSRGVATHSVGPRPWKQTLCVNRQGQAQRKRKTPSSHLRYQISVRSLQISPRAWELGTIRQAAHTQLACSCRDELAELRGRLYTLIGK
jgi:hypothetical protein